MIRWIKEVFLNFKRSGFMSLISIGTIVITITMLGGYYILNFSIEYFIQKFEKRFEIVVFLHSGMERTKIDNLITELKTQPIVKDVKFTSKYDAYNEFAKDKEMKEILDSFEKNPLPDSIIIKLHSNEKKDIKKIVSFLKTKDGIESIEYGTEEIENIINIINVIKIIAISIGIIFIISSLLVVSNIIKLTIYARRQDIYIFKMVGATDFFIRMPFILEGVIHGFLGGILGWGVIYVIIKILIVEIKKETGIDLSNFYIFKPEYFNIKFLLLSVLSGTILGFLGSLLSQGRFGK